jgi:hypothetical protein
MDKVIFQTNVPVELALRFLEGKPSESQFSAGMQHMFSTTDNRVFYVSETAGQAITAQLQKLEVEPGECITITKAEVDSGRGKRAIRWVVAPVSDAAEPVTAPPPPPPPAAVKRPAAKAPASEPVEAYGDRPDGTYAIPVLKPVPVPVAMPAPIAAEAPAWAQALLANTNVIVDVYASAVRHAAKHEGLVKPETVQSILVTALINMSKNSTLTVGK